MTLVFKKLERILGTAHAYAKMNKNSTSQTQIGSEAALELLSGPIWPDLEDNSGSAPMSLSKLELLGWTAHLTDAAHGLSSFFSAQ